MKAVHPSWEEAFRDLQVADLVLMRYKFGLVPHYIRKADHSYWNHAALVFDVPQSGSGRKDVLIIEALPEGIEVHRLKRYANDRRRYDIGVKRVPGLTDDERERIRSFFLDAVDSSYDYTRLFGFILRSAIARLLGVKSTDYIRHRVINPGDFTCTSFAQRAFYLALPPEKRERVYFKKGIRVSFSDKMETVTPGDIARSENTEWLYNPHK